MTTRCKPIETLAYVAGVIDSEGSISISRTAARGRAVTPKYVARLGVGSCDHKLLAWLLAEFGGSICSHKPSKEGYRPTWNWELTTAPAAEVLRSLLPYMRTKRAQAELLIYFQDTRGDNRGFGRWYLKVTPEEAAWREGQHEKMQALNGRQQRLSEGTSRTDEAIV